MVGGLISIRDYLVAIATDDPLIKTFYGPAIDWCDNKIDSRDFTANPPDGAVLGVYLYTRVMWDYHQRSDLSMKKKKTGGREDEYFEAGVAGRTDAAALAAWPKLEPYHLDAILGQSGGL